MNISGALEGELEIKRFYLQGLTIIDRCPKCGAELDYDDYLSYPEMNMEMKLSRHCGECKYEWDQKVILKVELIAID